jgi:molybdopterin synthase sulfur carrier subunit
MIKIVYFSRLREQLGIDQEQLEIPASGYKVADLQNLLIERNAACQKAFSNHALLVAVNHQMADVNTLIKPGDEVGIFPPVTGG